jgi:hypothetical protein
MANTTRDANYTRYVGWREITPGVEEYFSENTVKLISKKVTELTRGVDVKNRKIIVPDYLIANVMDGVYQGYRPPTGDIYSRYIISTPETNNMIQEMIDQTIEIIVSNIRNQLGMEQYNSTLSTWVQVYGDFNTAGLRQHAPITTRERKPATMQFNMNY